MRAFYVLILLVGTSCNLRFTQQETAAQRGSESLCIAHVWLRCCFGILVVRETHSRPPAAEPSYCLGQRIKRMFIPWCEVQICQELPLGWLQAAFVSVKSVQTSGPRELTQRRICDPQGFLRRLWAEWGPGGLE